MRQVALRDPGAAVADDDLASRGRRRRRRPPAGSTWPRCRAGSRPRGRSRPGRRGAATPRARSRTRPPASCAAPARPRRRRRRSSRTSSGSCSACSPRASSTSSVTSPVSSPELLDDVARGSAAAPPRAGRGRRWSTSMFVRRLVSGVRSSCEASATSCRCAFSDRSSASSIVLKLSARRESSSRPFASIRLSRSCVSVTCSVARVSRRTGASAARATTSPSAPAMRDPAERDEQEQQAQVRERAVDLGERARDLERDPAAERGGQHAQVVAVDRRVAEGRARSPRGDARGRASSPAGRGCSGRGADDAARGDELHVAGASPNGRSAGGRRLLRLAVGRAQVEPLREHRSIAAVRAARRRPAPRSWCWTTT